MRPGHASEAARRCFPRAGPCAVYRCASGADHARCHVRPSRVKGPRARIRRQRAEARGRLQPHPAAFERFDRRARDGIVDGATRVVADDDDRRQRRLLQLDRRLAERVVDARRRRGASTGGEAIGGRHRLDREPPRRPRSVQRELVGLQHDPLPTGAAQRAAACEQRVLVHAGLGKRDPAGQRCRRSDRALPRDEAVRRPHRPGDGPRQRQQCRDSAGRRRARGARHGGRRGACRCARRRPADRAHRIAQGVVDGDGRRRRRARARPRRQGDPAGELGRSAFRRPAVRAGSTDGDRPASGRPHRADRDGRSSAWLERRDPQLGSRLDAAPLRLRHGFRARLRRLDDDRVRRTRPQPAI